MQLDNIQKKNLIEEVLKIEVSSAPLPSPKTDRLDEFKALVAKMTKDERLAAIEHLKLLVA